MKKNILAALLQGGVIFLITGLLCLAAQNNFFYRYLPLVLGVLAALVRFGSASLLSLLGELQTGAEDQEKKESEL